MNAELLLKEFYRISDASDCIPKLRQFILNLAIRGKLVEQRETDGFAGEMLDRIRSRREELTAKKLIRPVRAEYGNISAGETFRVPPSWALTTLGEVCDLQTGATPSTDKSEYFGGHIRWLVSGDINKGEIFDCEGRITDAALRASNCKILPPDSVMIALNGQGKTRGTVALLRVPAACNQSLVALIPILNDCLLADYLFWNLRARYLPIRHLTGHEDRRGLNMKLLSCLSLSLPPAAEQIRIVASVKKLMSFCDELESAHAKREACRDKLVTASLHRLSSAAGDPTSFHESARFYLNHLPRLTARPEHIQQLRETILELAVQGKLADQGSLDGSASDLIAKVADERKRRVQAGIIKTPSPLVLVGDEQDVDYKLPAGWQFCFVDELAIKVTDGEHATPARSACGRYLLSARNITDNGIALSDVDFVPDDEYIRIRRRCDPDQGDILISCSGSVGRIAVVDESDKYVMVRSVALIKLYVPATNPFYVAYALRSPSVQRQIIRYSRSTAQANLFLSAIRKIRIPVPPFPQQKIVVSKLDELMTLCNELDGNWRSRSVAHRALLESTLQATLASTKIRSEVAAGA